MRYTNVLAAAMVAPLVAAHGGDIPGAPKMFGLPKDVRRRYPPVAHAIHHEEAPKLEARQGGAGGQCGPTANGAKCDDGYCCSGSGWCGKGTDYCRAPDCLFQYGSGCDANQTPAGASTRNDVRAPLGNVEKGVGIYKCRQPGTVAITYDDGPYSFTGDVLDKFNAAGAKATFFITGNNIGKGAIDTTSQWSSVIKRMVAEGHQVASHTWSHQNLDSITEEEIYDQMVKNEMALRNILGKYPTYMRPPYSACVTEKCLNIMGKLGYVVSYFDLDTDDYNLLTKEKIETAKLNFKNGVDGAKSDVNGDHRLAIGHDIHQLTAEDLTIYMLEYLKTTGYKAVTMGECMNDPEANWYRSSTPGSTTPSSTRSASTAASTASGTSSGSTSVPTGKVSTDGNCGSAAGTICSGSTFGNCCSQYNFCGSTADHCGSGCNPLFGTCGQVSSSVSSVVSSSSASQSAFVSTSKPAPSTAVSTASQSVSGKQSSSAVPTTDKNSSAPAPTSKASSAGSSAVSSPAQHGASSTSVEHGSSSGVEHESYPTGASSAAEYESYPTGASSAAEYESYPTGASAVEYESYPTGSESSYGSKHDDYSVASSKPSTPHASVSSVVSGSSSSTVPTNNRSSSTDCSTSTPVPVTSAVYATRSASATTECTTSTFATAVRSSTPSPTPTGPVVSKDGKCGGKDGQTCSGYKNPFGQAMECCCKTSGKCSNDPWACGQGCDKSSGKCSSY